MKRVLLSVLLAAIIYSAGVLIVLTVSGHSIIAYLSKMEFWLTLILVVLIAGVFGKWPRQSRMFIMRLVPIILLALGITLILLSRYTSLWQNPPWNPSVFGAGVSITALGMTLLIVFWPSQHEQLPRTQRVNQDALRTASSKLFGVRNIIRDSSRGHPLIVLGLLFTFILLVVFALLQQFLPSVLELDVRWIVVAAIPLVLALLIGGYVRVIKGFGIELETKIEEPIASLDLKAGEVFTTVRGIRKQTLGDLLGVSIDQRRRIARLQFVIRKRGYYDLDTIRRYMHELPTLEYFEVIRPDGTFVCLLPVHLFYEEMQYEIGRFVEALERNKILYVYGHDAITFSVSAEQSIINVLGMLRSNRLELAVVLGSEGVMIGVIKTSDIEKRIADEVLFEARRRKK